MKNQRQKLLFIILLFFICITGVYAKKMTPAPKTGAVVSLSNIAANIGDTVTISLNASELNDVSAITLSVKYDSAVLTWVGTDSVAAELNAGTFLSNVIDNNLRAAWFSLNPTSFNKKLFDLKFVYNGGTSSIYFVANQCDFASSSQRTIPVTYIHGGISRIGQEAPPAPVLISPATGGTDLQLNQQFVWHKTDSTVYYNLQIATDAGFNNLVENKTGLVDTFCNISNLASNTRYYWRVSSSNFTGAEAYSEVWDFSTIFYYSVTLNSNPAAGGTTTGGGSFLSGSTDTVKASPNFGYTFVNWTDGATVVSTDSVYIFTVTGARTLTANFTPNNYLITVTANPAAGGTVTGAGSKPFGSTDTARATANNGYSFANWTDGGTVVSTSSEYVFTVNGSRTLTANFIPNTYTITLLTSPVNGGTTTGAGNYSFGQTDTIRAIPNAGYNFVYWTEGANIVSSSPEYSFVVTGNRTLTANFNFNNYTITTSSNPPNGGTTSGGGNFYVGQSDTVRAVANTGYTFVNWTEGSTVVSTNPVYAFVVSSSRNLVANFSLNTFQISVNSNPPTGGIITGAGTFGYGTIDTLRAIPNAGYFFVNWTEGESVLSTSPAYVFTVTAARNITANFVLSSHTITTNSNPQNGGTTSGGGDYYYGTTDTVRAFANPGFTFVNWKEGNNIVSTDSVYAFVVRGPRVLTANFSLNSYVVTTSSNPQNGGSTSGGGAFNYGQVDTVKAAANAGYTFVNWTEGSTVVSDTPEYIFTVNSSRNLTANFSHNSYLISTASNPQEGGTTTGGGMYYYGDLDTLRAFTNPGYSFVNWTEGTTVVSNSLIYIFTVNGARTLTANFSRINYNITTTSMPANGGTTAGGGAFTYGQLDTVTAVPNQGYSFLCWKEDTLVVSNSAVYGFVVTASRNLVAHFTLNSYQITTTSNPAAGGVTTGGGNYFYGDIDTVKAVANAGYTFVCWKEGTEIVSTNPVYIFTVNRVRNLTAEFSINSYSVTLNANPLNGGTVTGGGVFNYGKVDTVKAIPAAGYMFVNWTEGANVVSTNSNYIFTVTGTRNLTANFCSIIVTSPNGGEIWLSGSAHSITWLSDNVANFKIDFTTDGGSVWQNIAPSVPASLGYFDWTIPNTESSNCKVRISDAANQASFDASDLNFTISNNQNLPVLTLGTAVGGAGDSLIIPLNVKNLANAGAITLNIQFDTAKVSFGRALNLDPKISSSIIGSSNGNIMILWDGVPAINLPDNKLLDLKFYFKGAVNKSVISFKIKECEITDVSGGKFQVSYVNGAVLPGVTLSGKLVYANTSATPLSNVKVYLKDPVNIVDSTYTNSSGNFAFNGKGSGTYKYSFVCDKPWGGVNSTDALLIRRFISYAVTFDSLQIKCADVNRSGSINSTDALLIRRRVAFIDTAFAIGNWAFEEPVFTVGTSPVEKTIRCLASGDVNASYVFTAAKQNSPVNITYINHKVVNNSIVDLPVTLTKNIELGALTMYIEYDPSAVMIEGVGGVLPDVTYSISNGKISIAWDDVKGYTVYKNEPVIMLKGRVIDAKKNITLSLSNGCELAAPSGSVVKDNLFNTETIELNLPKQFELTGNYPNPFNPSTSIMYSIPEEMQVALIIYDVLGREVKTLVSENMKPGTYNTVWHGDDNHGAKVTSGIYIYKLKGNNSTSVKKMIMLK